MRTTFCCSPSLIFSSPASSAKLRLRSNSRSCQRNIKNKPTIKKLTTEYSEFDIISKICLSRQWFHTDFTLLLLVTVKASFNILNAPFNISNATELIRFTISFSSLIMILLFCSR